MLDEVGVGEAGPGLQRPLLQPWHRLWEIEAAVLNITASNVLHEVVLAFSVPCSNLDTDPRK